ncbi:hypothetical protein [Dyadobacter pollutisoli]|uniref:Uncharacterized protein n=1 Tax=Dyadobacter pollutisoli TaxID=2910158 RepID=A0A9E8N9T1_9BACT|nr:hypothetical protein [Dyadobacter pollutisoli]WAC12530.1 hypothetical protein ON006_00920 [Dyadobacter pollutisoli]
MNKRYQATMASTHVDSHGDMITREALEDLCVKINLGEKKIKMSVEHRRDFPPMGRLENAQVVEKDGFHYLLVEMVSFPDPEQVTWNPKLMIQQFDDAFQFIEVDDSQLSKIEVAFDTINFTPREQAFSFAEKIKEQSPDPIEVNFLSRKSDIPDPEIVFRFLEFQALYQFSKPILKKLGEAVADKAAEVMVEKSFETMKHLFKVLRDSLRQMVPKNKPVSVIFDIPGKPHIELIAKTRYEGAIKKAFSKKRLDKVKSEITDLLTEVPISKIQFIMNSDSKWKFNYLITEKGQVIGTKESFEQRTKVYNSVGNKNARAANKHLRGFNDSRKKDVKVIMGAKLSDEQ